MGGFAMRRIFVKFNLVVCFLTIVLMKEDGRASWVQMGNLAPSNEYVDLAAGNGNLYVGTNTKGIVLSKDNGATWTSVNNGLPIDTFDTTYYSVKIIAANKSRVFSFLNTGSYNNSLYSSSNNGETWVKINVDSGYVWNFALCDTILFIAKCGLISSCPIQLFSSFDKGLSWQALNTMPSTGDWRYVYVPLPIAMAEGNIFAGICPSGVFLSANDGVSWQPVNYGLSSLLVSSLAASGANLFAGTQNGNVFVSANNGASWQKADTGLPIFSFALSGFHGRNFVVAGDNVFACSDSGVYLTSTKKYRWTPVNTGLKQQVIDLALQGDYLFALTDGDGIWRRPLSEMQIGVIQGFSKMPNSFGFDIRNNAINFVLPRETFVSLNIYDLKGKLMYAVLNKMQSAGSYSLPFKIASFSSGNYLVCIKAGKLASNRRIAIVR
jgi:photosystem II stability/assembly factor-like uncharacterized protein